MHINVLSIYELYHENTSIFKNVLLAVYEHVYLSNSKRFHLQ